MRLRRDLQLRPRQGGAQHGRHQRQGRPRGDRQEEPRLQDLALQERGELQVRDSRQVIIGIQINGTTFSHSLVTDLSISFTETKTRHANLLTPKTSYGPTMEWSSARGHLASG